MLKAKDFRFYAREALKGRWLKAGGVGLVAGLLGASIDMAAASGGSGSSAGSEVGSSFAEIGNVAGGGVASDVSAAFMAIFLGIMLVVLIYAIVMAVIGGATTLGYAKYNLNLVDDKNPKLKDIFSQYNRLGTGFGMQFFRGLFIMLWSLLLIVPGIIASYSYYMTPYILCEHPEMTAREAIKESKQLMKGNKWRLFCLELSFIGWELLFVAIAWIAIMFLVSALVIADGTSTAAISMVLTVFIIVIVILGVALSLTLSPYIIASTAVFYREISEGRYSNPQVEGSAEEYTDETWENMNIE